MAPAPPRLRILSVGGNAVSAFLSWRLQATNACDVTLVWKANHQAVAQYGISFKSKLFGNERFKPRFVVQTPEDAANPQAAFDYVILCVKALPDVYNLADIIESVVTPQHTCILVNTSNTLGVEKELEQRFPTNVVLSLVSGAEITQLGSSEFEHTGSTEVWVGAANLNDAIPEAIQNDMSEALAMTLTTGKVDCKVSSNIRQQQYERMIGPVAFHPASVLFETPVLAELLRKPGVQELVHGIITEMVTLATANRCSFPADFARKTIANMTASSSSDHSTMYQDYLARRPMEVETYLGSSIELARASNVKLPRIETLYTLLRHINTANQSRPPHPQSPTSVTPVAQPPVMAQPPPRIASMQPPPRQPGASMGMNGGPRPRGPPMGHPMGPPGRRGPPPVNGYRGPPHSYPPQMQRRPSFDEANLDEFSHVVLYDDVPDGDAAAAYGEGGGLSAVAIRERELALRERELQFKQHEMAMRNNRGRRPSHNRHQDFDDSEGEDDYFDPTAANGHVPVNADVDMMSVTSRRTRRAPSQGQLRREMYSGGPGSRGGFRAQMMGRNRASTHLVADMPLAGENILNNPMMGFSSNRYGSVDRKEMQEESRANSLTAARLHEMAGPGTGPYPVPPNRRTSRSPGNPFGAVGRGMNRPSPPNDQYAMNGRPNGRPSPPGGMPAPTPRYPPGQGNMVQPHQVEQQVVGVSKPIPPPKFATKSLTGSASASAGSGDSGSANLESAHSSTSSFAPRAMLSAGVH